MSIYSNNAQTILRTQQKIFNSNSGIFFQNQKIKIVQPINGNLAHNLYDMKGELNDFAKSLQQSIKNGTSIALTWLRNADSHNVVVYIHPEKETIYIIDSETAEITEAKEVVGRHGIKNEYGNIFENRKTDGDIMEEVLDIKVNKEGREYSKDNWNPTIYINTGVQTKMNTNESCYYSTITLMLLKSGFLPETIKNLTQDFWSKSKKIIVNLFNQVKETQEINPDTLKDLEKLIEEQN